MSVKNENAAGGESVVLERPAAGVYASLFEKINLNPVAIHIKALHFLSDSENVPDLII